MREPFREILLEIFARVTHIDFVQTRLRSHLDFLYDAATAAATETALRELIARHRLAAPPHAGPAPALSQRDTLLITYGDQVTEPGAAPLHTLAEFAATYLAGVVSGIHILPFYPWSSDDGFSVKDYFAVDPALGGWDEIRALGRRFDLMFDAVFNHMSAESEWFQRFLRDDPEFRDFFVTVTGHPDLSQVVRPRALPLLTNFETAAGPRRVWTTFSADQVDLNFKNPQVLRALVAALLFYVAQGARFIRLDAIAFLWKEIGTPCLHLPQTHHVIQLLRTVLDAAAPQVRLITETNVPHRDNISYFGDGTNEAQLVYNFALPPLVLHTLAMGNAEKLTAWAQSLQLPSDQVTFFNFLASHDGIGLNPARGILSPAEIDALVARATAHGGFVSYKNNPDGTKSPYELNINYFDALSNPAGGEPLEIQVGRFVVAHGILLALAGLPGIYFHSLFGSRGDRTGAESSGIPRRINRQKLTRAKLETELEDAASLRAQVFSRLRQLLERRRNCAAFEPAGTQKVLAVDPRVFAVWRQSPDGRTTAVCLHNVTAETVMVKVPPPAAAGSGCNATHTLAPYAVEWMLA
ncbi:MAG TPA: sugar phosphorylase [Dongiaceae bacterium]|jgi:sucrose phosphorylase|nr:sugar phosphorylase [Dongiaceae bacterium]